MRPILILIPMLILLRPSLGSTGPLPVWEFDSQETLTQWAPNAHLVNVRIEGGAMIAEAAGSDPFIHNKNLKLSADHRQFLVIRVRANRPGPLELFWSGETEGRFGGLTEAKKESVLLRGDGSWEEIPIFPFWHTEGTIRQIRLDFYEGAEFALDAIAVREWSSQGRSGNEGWSWSFEGDLSKWRTHPRSDLFLAPTVEGAAAGRRWALVRMSSNSDGIAAVVWATQSHQGLQTEEFEFRGDGKLRTHAVDLGNSPGWEGSVLAFGLRIPSVSSAGEIRVDTIQLSEAPEGPPEWVFTYFGFENQPNRAGKACRLLACLKNIGAETAELESLHLEIRDALRLIASPPVQEGLRAGFGETVSLNWTIISDQPGVFPVTLTVEGGDDSVASVADLTFTAPLGLEPSEYVPEPLPIRTLIDVCAYYFPGWESPRKWDCIIETAPIRKPVLGYYDEGDPECVDWQIKWAVENGISCFLVDWYWIQGRQHLLHWFEAYRKSRYRDLLKVAIMWANHNPVGTHSREDWRDVSKHWIDHYFTLDSYYHIDGKPAVFLWDPRLIRADLGGTEEVKAAFEESQQAARGAGLEGIHFVALHDHESPMQADRLLAEGYHAATNYHEWGEAPSLAPSPGKMRFRDVVETASEIWRKRDLDCGGLAYYPVVDTGWDSFPWHGKKAQSIRERTPELFEDLLAEARTFCLAQEKPLVVLGPVNEWGEGSYIEPCTEFGFEMMERIRKVFAADPPDAWPVNTAPFDVGLGPYDYPEFAGR